MTNKIKTEKDLDEENFDDKIINIPKRDDDDDFPEDHQDFSGASDDGLYANDR